MSNDPKMPMVQIFTPDGQLADIPYERLHDALAAGGKIGAKVKTPDGQIAFVPGDRVNDALKAGATRIPLDGNDADGGKPGFWSQAWDKFKSQIPSNLDEAGHALGATNWDPMQTQAGRATTEYLRSRDAGAGIGRSALNAAGTAVGVDPAQEEANARAGNTAGVAADAAVPIAETLLGYGAHLVAPAAADAATNAASRAKPSLLNAAEILKEPQKIPGKAVEAVINKIPDTPEVAAAKARLAQETEGEQVVQAMKIQDPVLRREAVAKAKAVAAAAKPAAPFPSALGPETPTPKQVATSQALSASPEPASPIVTSQSPEIPSEGRPATWRNLSVSNLASKGGPLAFDAAKQAQLRQLDVPNVGLVADPRATVGGAGLGSSAERLARLREIAGYPTLPGGPGDFTSQAAEPKYLYRIRPVGEKGVPAGAANSPAQLTTSLEQAESWSPSKEEEGPHEIIRVPVSSLKPGQTRAQPFSPEIDWHKTLQAIPESDVEVVRPHPEEVESE